MGGELCARRADLGTAMQLNAGQHLRFRQDEQGIVWLGIEVRGEKVNVLRPDILLELENVGLYLTAHKPRGLVLYSHKVGEFISGFDLNFFSIAQDRTTLIESIRRGQQVFNTLAQLDIPSVTLIDGHCFSIGVELALTTTYRIASDAAHTLFGFPEIKLGLHLAFGGTVRVIERIGARAAMDMMLKGYTINATEALKRGLVDAVCAPTLLEATARHYILNQPRRYRAAPFAPLIDNALVRPWLVKKWHQELTKRHISPEHYPAAHALLNLWGSKGHDHAAMYEAEIMSVVNLTFSEQVHHLIRLFFLRNRLKALGKQSDFRAKHVHVIGTGLMGRAIATWCVGQGLIVTVQDINLTAAQETLTATHTYLDHRERGNTARIHQLLAQLNIATKDHSLLKADVIIEAIPEKLAAKQELLAWIEEQVRPDALIATTTSTLPLDKLAAVLLNPERLVGLHFLNPALTTSLVEVIHEPVRTDPERVKQACAFVRQINKLPLPVKNTPGYLINRIIFAYILQGIRLYQQQVPHTVLDKAGVDFGMPFGPLQLADLYGLDYCRQVGELLAKSSVLTLPDLLVTMTNAGKLGRKSGAGFYRYRYGQALKSERVIWEGNVSTLQDKLINYMVEEAALCLEQGIVEDPDLLDVAVVCGTGFAPFRGGPLHYAQSLRKEALTKGEHV